MTRDTLPCLLAELDDLLARIKEAGLPVGALERARKSLPRLDEESLVERNRRILEEANARFRESRELMCRIRRTT